MSELNTIQLLVVLAPSLLLAITLHEVAHGWMALRLGDATAQSQGRLSLNPLRHVDPVGTVLIPGLLALLGGFIFGWAKPVPVNVHRLRRPKRDMALVALAGPLANLAMAVGWGLAALVGHNLRSELMLLMGVAGIRVNVMLAVLNLLPIPPLDGSRVLVGLLPERFGPLIARIEPYGLWILLALLLTGLLNLLPLVNVISHFIVTLFF